MIRQCAWCGAILGQTPPLEDKSTTHAVCIRCQCELLEQLEPRLRADDESHATWAYVSGSAACS